MDWWGRLWGAKKWSLAGVPAFLSGERLWAIVVLGIVLILAVCWLACRFKDDDIETPLITLRRGKSKKKGSKKRSEEPKEEKDSAST